MDPASNAPQDGMNPEGTVIPEVTLDGTEDVEALKVKLKEQVDLRTREAEARRQLTARAKTAEEELKKLKPTSSTITKEKEFTPRDILRDEAFKLYREGYDEDEIDLIIKNGGRDILKDKNHPLALGLIAKREQRRAEEAAQAASGSGGSESIGTVTLDQMKKMKSSDLEKILPHA